MQRAVYSRYGGPEVLTTEQTSLPVPGPRQVLIRQAASSVNGGDEHARAGHAKAMTSMSRGFPKGLGMDVVGTIEETGEKVTDWAGGEFVWGVSIGSDANAEYVVMDADRMALAPNVEVPATLGGLPAVGATAITALGPRYANLATGESVLIRGGGGGVGSALVQLAHHAGAHVTALVSPKTFEAVRDLGADEVVDYSTTSPEDLGPFDVIVDTVATDLPGWRSRLAKGGRFVTITMDFAHPLRSLAAVAGSTIHGGERIRMLVSPPKRATMEELTHAVESGALAPVIDSTFALDAIADAHARAGVSGLVGKVVLSIDS